MMAVAMPLLIAKMSFLLLLLVNLPFLIFDACFGIKFLYKHLIFVFFSIGGLWPGPIC